MIKSYSILIFTTHLPLSRLLPSIDSIVLASVQVILKSGVDPPYWKVEFQALRAILYVVQRMDCMLNSKIMRAKWSLLLDSITKGFWLQPYINLSTKDKNQTT